MQIKWRWCTHWAIPLYTPTDDNKWCPGGYREYVPFKQLDAVGKSRYNEKLGMLGITTDPYMTPKDAWGSGGGGCHLNPCPGGLEGIIEACPGGSGNNIEDCPVQGGGAKQKLVQGAFTSLSLGVRGIIQACPGVFL